MLMMHYVLRLWSHGPCSTSGTGQLLRVIYAVHEGLSFCLQPAAVAHPEL